MVQGSGFRVQGSGCRVRGGDRFAGSQELQQQLLHLGMAPERLHYAASGSAELLRLEEADRSRANSAHARQS